MFALLGLSLVEESGDSTVRHAMPGYRGYCCSGCRSCACDVGGYMIKGREHHAHTRRMFTGIKSIKGW